MAEGFDIDCRVARPGATVDARFSSPAGLTAIFGPSGAGKTTVLEAIAGLIRPVDGDIRVAGRALQRLPPERRRLGYVPQDIRLFPHMTVARNIAFMARAPGAGVDLLDLGRLMDRMPATLSGGEARRVAIARALARQPAALLLDEPMAGLDPPRRRRLLPFIERVAAEARVPVLYVSHYAEEVVRLADHAVLMVAGRTVAAGPAADVFADPGARAHLGRFDIGSVLTGIVAQSADGLTRLTVAGGELLLAGADHRRGDALRLRILARDVALARVPPVQTSLMNIAPVTLVGLTAQGDREMLADLRLGHGAHGAALTAMVTAAAAARLALRPGDRLHALIKAVAATPGR